MFFSRIFSLFGGKLRRWVKTREARDPEAVYESAIADRVRRYQQLKAAAAGVIYMRSKLERELKQKTTELTEIAEQSVQAADMNEDQCALILLRRKHELDSECERLKEDLTQLTAEAEDAKKNLVAFKDEIEKLKVEKVRMMARLRNAQARVRIQQALESLSYDEDVRSLEEVRESIAQMLAQAGVNRELHSAEVDEKLGEIRSRAAQAKAEAELDEIKRRRRGLVPMDAFVQNGANGNPHVAGH
jgi:phage shock protein A